MLILRVVSFCIALFIPLICSSAEHPVFPGSIGKAPALPRTGDIKTWDPDTMFEHVNGEAELLKRYGVVRLAYTYYENEQEDYLSVDLLDMGRPINAYGLYRLYAGCEDGEYQIAGATVLGGDYTSYAILGHYFVRINAESSDAAEAKALVDDFLQAFAEEFDTGSAGKPLPVLEYLQKKAQKPCEVLYHPEHLDYDLEAGPGYTWVGTDGETYFLNLLPTESEAKQQAEMLRQKGITALITSGKAVIWQKEGKIELGEYPKTLVMEIGSDN